MDLGATRFGAVRLVLFPELWPAVVAAGLLVFALSFDDFVISFFTTGEDVQPLPVRIWSAIRFGVSPTINAIGTLMMVVSITAVVAAVLIPRFFGRKESGHQGPDRTGRRLRWCLTRSRSRGCPKRFGDFTAVDDIDLSIPNGEFFCLLGPVGLRQDDDAADARRLRGADRGPDPARGRAGRERAAVRAQRQHGLPELRALRPSRRRGQRRLRPQAEEAAEGRDRAARRRRARARRARQQGARPAEQALRRSAPARRPGARARQPPRGAPPRRAARRARPEAPPPDAGRAEADPARGRDHVRLRDPRPGGGALDVGPDRRHVGRADRPVRPARGHLRAPDRGVRRRLHRHLEPARGRRRGGRHGPDRHGPAHRGAAFPTAAGRGRRSRSRSARRRSRSTTRSRKGW